MCDRITIDDEVPAIPYTSFLSVSSAELYPGSKDLFRYGLWLHFRNYLSVRLNNELGYCLIFFYQYKGWAKGFYCVSDQVYHAFLRKNKTKTTTKKNHQTNKKNTQKTLPTSHS